MIRRRDFITLLGGLAAGGPIAARAQRQPERMRRVGVLSGSSESDPEWQSYQASFWRELARLGWVEGRNVRVDRRFGQDDASSRRRGHRMRIAALVAGQSVP